MSGGSVQADEPPIGIWVTSILGYETHLTLVEITVGEQKILIPPTKAREIAGYLLECASAAEGDQALWAVGTRQAWGQGRILDLLRAQRHERSLIEQAARIEARRAIAEDQMSDDLPE